MPDLRTPSPTLVSAARDKAWPDLQRFLSNDEFGNVDGVDGQGRTALLYAAGYGDLAAVRALCEAGADVNAGDRAGMTPLHWACLKAHAPVVELLLNSKADAFVSATAGIFKGRCALDLADHADKPSKDLSGGNRRKLSAAIALVARPAVSFLDEPSSGMDVATRQHMWQVILSSLQSSSVVLTTHSMASAATVLSPQVVI